MGVRAVSAFLVAALGVISVASAAQAEEPRVISTSGEAVVYVRPDEAVVAFGIESFAPKLDKAKEANEQAAAKLLKAVKTMNVDEKCIQTDVVQVDIKYEDGNHPVRGIEGYYARRSYSVTLKDVKQLEKFIDAILANGANQLGGVEYRSTELRKYRDQARKMAAVAAREKGEALAKELNCKIGSPRNISEGGVGYYGNNLRYSNGNMQVQNAAVAVAGDDGGQETIPMGQIGIRASVAVTFDLIP